MNTLARVGELPAFEQTGSGAVPHVIAWNLTRRCNLECAHCYIAAGPRETAEGELSTDACLRIAGEILQRHVGGVAVVAVLDDEFRVRPRLHQLQQPLRRHAFPMVVEPRPARDAMKIREDFDSR